ncbi:MAG: TetR/AcrR family transcriptional regulator [Aeromicrobium sp.]
MTEKATRRRGLILEQAILDAAWLELSDRGWSGFTMEGVAARSGAAKTVVYRRWRNRADLVQHMLNEAASKQAEFLSSHDLREDLVRVLSDICTFVQGPFGQAIRGTLSTGDLINAPSVFDSEPVVARLRTVMDGAVARGDLRAEPSPLAVNLGHSVVMWEFIATGSPPTHDGVVTLVDDIWLPALHKVP